MNHCNLKFGECLGLNAMRFLIVVTFYSLDVFLKNVEKQTGELIILFWNESLTVIELAIWNESLTVIELAIQNSSRMANSLIQVRMWSKLAHSGNGLYVMKPSRSMLKIQFS